MLDLHGVRTYISNKFPLWDAAGKIVSVCSISTDITERKQDEHEILAAREAAESANRAKSSFLAVMSHEIRTPMNAIINMTGLALDTELTPKQQQYLSVSHSSAKNLLGIINDILDFSKIEAEKLELEQAPFSLRSVLEEVTETFRARVVEKHVELITHVVHDVPNELIGDALRLRQVITNLVGNAFKFTSALILAQGLFLPRRHARARATGRGRLQQHEGARDGSSIPTTSIRSRSPP